MSRPRASYARSLRAEKGGDPPEFQHSYIEYDIPKREGGEPLNQ